MSMLPIQVGMQLQEAAEDQVITTSETTQMMTSIFSSVVGAIVIAFGMVMFSRVIGSNPGNPGNPDGSLMTDEIIGRAGLKPYELVPMWVFEEAEEPKKVRPVSIRSKEVGPYLVRMVAGKESCSVKLYEYLPGWKQKLRATWSGMSREEGEAKFDKVVETIKQVRYEHKTALGS